MNTLQLLDILKLGESEDLECKKSKNEVPKSLWDTYSAMANTNGGIILLGIDEVDNELIITGVENVDKVIKDFWSTLNGEKVNKNILKNEDLELIKIEEENKRNFYLKEAIFCIRIQITFAYRRWIDWSSWGRKEKFWIKRGKLIKNGGNMFKLHSEYKPTGDQPNAIKYLSKGIEDGKKYQTLLGVTGSRKNFYNGKYNSENSKTNIGFSTQ